jgi:hypothetical protein
VVVGDEVLGGGFPNGNGDGSVDTRSRKLALES